MPVNRMSGNVSQRAKNSNLSRLRRRKRIREPVEKVGKDPFRYASKR